MRLNNTQRGMTLIEIMIVLTIIGGLMALLANRFLGASDKAKVKEARILISSVVDAVNMYALDCGNAPSEGAGLEALIDTPGEDECQNWGPQPYLKRVPKDPWNNELIYQVDGGNFVIISLGKDGRPEGSGYDADISSEDL